MKHFDRDIFDAIEDKEIENETLDFKEFLSYVKKIAMKIWSRTEKLKSSATNIVASIGKNESY